MENTRKRFDLAINTLVKAYMKGTLAKGAACGCAVGNIVASANSLSIEKQVGMWTWSNGRLSSWDKVFSTHSNGTQDINLTAYSNLAKEEIDSTGYSWQELAKIEHAFERATQIWFNRYAKLPAKEIEADQYNGLVAVFNVMCEIESIADAEPYVQMLRKDLPSIAELAV